MNNFILFVFLKFYLFDRERERERERVHRQGGRAEVEGEAGSPLSMEPKAGLDPRTLESEPKADA